MRTSTAIKAAMMSVSFAALAMVTPAAAQQVQIDNNDIGGVVTGANGPEAGVWVIAETKDLPTRYIKIVTTDDRGRYVIPDLPRANYDVWVRGYGLVNSPKQKSAPGRNIDLKAVPAPSRAAAAEYYPAQYWYAMLKMPAANLFPGTGANGNGMAQTMSDRGMWFRNVKTDGCVGCHQIGNKATRTIPAALGHFNSSAEAWERRLQSGQASGPMMNAIRAHRLAGREEVEATKDAAASQGWSPFVLTTAERQARCRLDGTRCTDGSDEGQADHRRPLRSRPNPLDGSIWGSVTGFPGGVVRRFDPKPAADRVLSIPVQEQQSAGERLQPARLGHLERRRAVVRALERSRGRASTGRTLQGQAERPQAAADMQNLCPEGFRLYQMPGPEFDVPAGTIGASAEAPYYVWVDQTQHPRHGQGRSDRHREPVRRIGRSGQ